MSVRPAAVSDVPALREILVRGMSNDPVWRYCFPTSKETASTNQAYLENFLSQCLDRDNGDWHITVAEVPKSHRVVALAIWQTLGSDQEHHLMTQSIPDNTSSRDGSMASRLAAFQAVTEQSQKKHLGQYDQLLYLHGIVTHPDRKHQGYGKLLCKHVLHLAGQKNMVVACLASPFSGYVFYSGSGFSYCGRLSVDAPGERESPELQIMVRTPPPPQSSRRGSFLEWMGSRRPSVPDDQGHSHEEQGQPRRGSFLNKMGWAVARSPNDKAPSQ